MNMDLKKKMSQILALSLMLAMAVVFVPQMAAPAYANNGFPAIVTGSSILAENAGKDAAQKIFYGDRVWYVIEYDQKDGDGNVVSYTDPSGTNKPLYREGTATLLQEGAGDHVVFNSERNLPYSCAYGWLDSDSDDPQTPSNLRSFIDSRYLTGYNNEGTQVAAYLSAGEQAAISPRRLDGGGVYFNDPNYDKNKIYGAAVESAYLWPLSDAEVSVLPNSIKVVGQGIYWWLRSPGDHKLYPQAVNDSGTVQQGFFNIDNALGVRPAFDLNLQSVLFTSAAEGGKSSGTAGADALKAQSDQTNSGNVWKLTVADSSHSAFAVSNAIASENVVSVYYTGAATGDDEFISAIITDKPITDSTVKIKYYGRIAAASDANDASVTINIGDKFSNGDKLYVFNEQYNGDNKTDYASALQEITIPELISYKVTFKVKNGAWNDGATKDKTVTLSRYEDEDKALVLQDGDIPAVGNKPNANYKAGSWDVTPSTETAITKDTTYTYTYAAEKPSPMPTTVSGALMAKMTAKGSKNLALSWNQINGAEGYDIFFAKCGKDNACKLVKTIKGNKTLSWTKKKLKKQTAYKAVVKAYVMKDGKKSYVSTSPLVHAYTTDYQKNYTNAKSVTVKKSNVSLKAGKTYKIKASVKKLKKNKKLMPKSHEPKLRYLSSDTKIATVSSSGKITAEAKGSCKIYVYAHNGASKTVKFTVK